MELKDYYPSKNKTNSHAQTQQNTKLSNNKTSSCKKVYEVVYTPKTSYF